MGKRASSELTLNLGITDPASAFAEFEQLLLSNSGEDAFDVAIKLLAAKLMDEIEVENAGKQARFNLNADTTKTVGAVTALYRAASKRWPLIVGDSPDLVLAPTQIVRCMRPLIGWKLLNSDLSHLDAALEHLLSRNTKGALGQYFTPREVIRLCVDVLNPTQRDKIIDPACGSGGFLFEAVQFCRQAKRKPPTCLGIDYDARSVRVAALLVAAMNSAAVSVVRANSIDGRDYLDRHPAEWDSFIEKKIDEEPALAQWGAWTKLRGSIVLTNPPFAGDVDELEIISAYSSQRGAATRKSKVGREHLFLERAINLLEPGGRLAIVLPQGVLANSSAAYLRTWVSDRCRVIGVVGLHQFTFLPHTGVKTSVLFLEKNDFRRPWPQNYPIFFAVSKNSGKDSSGRVVASSDYKIIGEQLSKFASSCGFLWAPADKKSLGDAKVDFEVVNSEEVWHEDRWDAEYYDPETRKLVNAATSNASGRISDHVSPVSGRFNKHRFGEFYYVDISAVDNRTGQIFATRVSSEDAPGRATYLVEPGDVLVSTVRPDRNVVALVSERREIPMVASNGFCVLRPKDIKPELLFAYCKSDTFRRLLTRHATASMYPTVSDRDILDMPYIELPRKAAEEVTVLMQKAQNLLREANALASQAADLMESQLGRQIRK